MRLRPVLFAAALALIAQGWPVDTRPPPSLPAAAFANLFGDQRPSPAAFLYADSAADEGAPEGDEAGPVFLDLESATTAGPLATAGRALAPRKTFAASADTSGALPSRSPPRLPVS